MTRPLVRISKRDVIDPKEVPWFDAIPTTKVLPQNIATSSGGTFRHFDKIYFLLIRELGWKEASTIDRISIYFVAKLFVHVLALETENSSNKEKLYPKNGTALLKYQKELRYWITTLKQKNQRFIKSVERNEDESLMDKLNKLVDTVDE